MCVTEEETCVKDITPQTRFYSSGSNATTLQFASVWGGSI